MWRCDFDATPKRRDIRRVGEPGAVVGYSCRRRPTIDLGMQSDHSFKHSAGDAESAQQLRDHDLFNFTLRTARGPPDERVVDRIGVEPESILHLTTGSAVLCWLVM